MESTEAKFPVDGIVPKTHTQVQEFLATHPEYDGRAIRICVADTGVDPGAAGLQTTTTGEPKMIDLVDCTSDGDVDCTTVVQGVLENDCLKLTTADGRVLKLPASWECPTKEYHIGCKRAYDLLPGGLVTRLKEENQKKWESSRRDLLAQQQDAALSTVVESMPFEDSGRTFDCVTFHDGTTWKAAVDTTGSGDFTTATLLCSFFECRQYGSFGVAEQCNFALNIYDDGNTLSIVTDAGPHGTHVASIIGGHYPEESWRNGIAPGAQLVGCKIGDTRLASEETMIALTRMLSVAVERKCELINLSFGEPIRRDNAGLFIQRATEIVNKHNIIFVAAAGNSGPALSTVDAPGGSTHALIAVGAHVTEDMMESMYSMRDNVPSTQYTWSSRGPSVGGDLGVSVSAPGGAIASVPQWTLKKNQLMNGTSMATPYVCGCIGLLLSGMKSQGLPSSPYSVRRALEATACDHTGSAEQWGLGHGLVQVSDAYAALVKQAKLKGEVFRHDVTVTVPNRVQGDGPAARGVYLREHDECTRPVAVSVTVDPGFPSAMSNADRAQYDMLMKLECNAPWVKAPSSLMMLSGGRSFSLAVDASTLEPGRAFFTEVVGYDSEDAEATTAPRALFRVPITVVKPLPLHLMHEDVVPLGAKMILSPSGTTSYDPSRARLSFGTLKIPSTGVGRAFVVPPAEATHAELILRPGDVAGSHMLMIHCVSLLPDVAFKDTQFKRDLFLKPHVEETFSFTVIPNRTMEVCLAHYWSSIGTVSFEAELVFHAVCATMGSTGSGLNTVAGTVGPMLQLNAAGIATPVSISTPLRAELLDPSASFTAVHRSIRPIGSMIKAVGGARDRFPPNHQPHELILDYSFSNMSGTVAPIVPSLADLLYDAPYETQFWCLKDSNLRVLGWGDGLYKYSFILRQNERYSIQLCIRHEDVALLKKIQHLPMILERTIKPKTTLDIFTSKTAALAGKNKCGPTHMAKGAHTRLYVAPPLTDKALPKDVSPGDVLVGELMLVKAAGCSSLKGVPIALAVSAGANAVPAIASERRATPAVLRGKHPLEPPGLENTANPTVRALADTVWHDALIRELERLNIDGDVDDVSKTVLLALSVIKKDDVDVSLAAAVARAIFIRLPSLPDGRFWEDQHTGVQWLDMVIETIKARMEAIQAETLLGHESAVTQETSELPEDSSPTEPTEQAVPAPVDVERKRPAPLVAQALALRFGGAGSGRLSGWRNRAPKLSVELLAPSGKAPAQAGEDLGSLCDVLVEMLRIKACVLGDICHTRRLKEKALDAAVSTDAVSGEDVERDSDAAWDPPKELNETMLELRQWVNVDVEAVALCEEEKDSALGDRFLTAFCEWRCADGLNLQAALAAITQHLASLSKSGAEHRVWREQQLELFGALQWDVMAEYARRSIKSLFPYGPRHTLL